MDHLALELATALASADEGRHSNFLTIPVGAACAFVLGWIWYSLLFGKAWLRLVGKTPEELGKPTKAMITSFLMLFVMALALYWQVHRDLDDALDGALSGLGIGVCFIATGLGINYAYQGRPFTLWLIDAGYLVLGLALIGALMGAWQS